MNERRCGEGGEREEVILGVSKHEIIERGAMRGAKGCHNSCSPTDSTE